MAKDKSRYFTFLLYPESIPSDWEIKLELLGVPMAISPLHDKDLSPVEGQEYKKDHYHVIYIAKNPVTADSVRKKIKGTLGENSVAMVQTVVHSMENMYLYLTHDSKDAIAKKKHKYDKKEIKLINNFDVDRYVTLDESEKKELRQTLLELVDKYNIVNIIELSAFIKKRGSEFGIDGMKYVNEVIASSSGIFRLYFDANYQCGYRPIYSKIIDSETGEIK
ncbi:MULTISPECIES: replication protein [Bacilli]|uniref:Replication protein RepB n=2 Tax=Bacilli TaxID=91061 RepID=A0ACC9MQ06_9STAP|nr:MULTISPECIES: replication protein [Bacilli]EKM1871767.1 replication protein [Listeria monocytogenes]HBM4320231.1 replication protein [Listeria innocua]PKE55510.1 replication protein RepB [Macrococcus caseolyticus]HAB7814134.1 replication protein RepB [Listeria monocytogenes]HBM4320307.1 replication protein [Listeria innocua]